MTSTAAQLGVLGPVEVRSAGGVQHPVGGSKLRVLLSLLVLHRNRAVSAPRLVHGLWGDAPPTGADVTLRSHVSHLRRFLAGVAPEVALTTGPAGYSLVLAPGQVDVERFEQLVGLAQEALGLDRPQRAAAHVREALRLWRGQPYSDLEEVDDAAVEAARLEEVRLGALEVLAAAELAAGRHREVVAELETLVAAHPFRERFTAQLMVALYRSGRQAEALDVYGRTRSLLADELGLDPGPELQTLSQSVLRQDPVLLGEAEPPDPGTPTRGPARTSPRPPDAVFATLARTRLVGRTSEVARLDAAWDAVGLGGRRLVLISGEEGIGKTHLVAGVAARAAERGHPVLVGRCDPAGRPYEPVAAALRSSAEVLENLAGAPDAVRSGVAPLLEPRVEVSVGGSAPPPDGSEVALYAGVTALLRRVAAHEPVLVVVDNAEQIDRASALLLRHVVERLPAGILVILCFRDPPGSRHPALSLLSGDLGAARDLVERIVLRPLDESELGDLVRDTVPDADRVVARLWRHTGGNPFYAKELARVLAEPGRDTDSWDVPVGVRDVLRHRLLALSARTREVLPVAAVLGAEVDFELLASVVRLPEEVVEDALDESVSAGLLVESGRSWAGAYAFPNDVVRDALRSQLTGLRLRSVHLRAAQALMARPRLARGGSAVVAAHLRAAGPAADPAEAAQYSLAAAEEARAVYAWDDAVEHAEAAVTLLEEAASTREHADAAVTAALLRLKSGKNYPRVVALLSTALRDYLVIGDEASAGVVHSRIGGALCMHHSIMDIPRALEHFAAAERLLPAPDSVYHLHRGRSQAAMLGLRTTLLAESAGRADAIASGLGRRDLTVVSSWAQGWAAFNAGHLADATSTWQRAWNIAHELADPYLGWLPVNAAALASNAYLLDPEGARAWCRRGLGQPRFTSFAYPHGAVVDQLVLALAAMGELAGAHEAAERLPQDALARRTLLYLDGHWEKAAAAWEAAAHADESAGTLHDASVNLRWLAAARITLGNREGAVPALERALRMAGDGPQVPSELDIRAELARLHAVDRTAEAEHHVARCDQIVAAGEHWRGVLGQVELARAAVAAAHGDDEAADTASAHAVRIFMEHRLPWRRAEALESWGALLEYRGEAADAARRRREAHDVYASISAAPRWRQGATP